MGARAHSTPPGTLFAFADLTGAVEAALAQAGGDVSARARGLMEALCSGIWRDGEAITLNQLTLAEFDAGLAALYADLYQTEIACQASCTACGEAYEFKLDLGALQTTLWHGVDAFDGPHSGEITAPSGRVFRLPRLTDLADLAARGRDHQAAWLAGFLERGDFDAEALETEMAEAGPILSQDLDAACPECGAAQTVRFDMARYLVESLEGEAAFLWREVHLLARGYHWSLSEILGLTRAVRREMAKLLVAVERPRVRAVS